MTTAQSCYERLVRNPKNFLSLSLSLSFSFSSFRSLSNTLLSAVTRLFLYVYVCVLWLNVLATFSELSRLTVVALLVWAILWFVAWIYEPRWSASDRWLVRLVFYLFFSFVPGDYAKVSVYWCCPDPTIRYALLSFVLAYCGILFIQLFETSHSPFFVLPLFLAPMIDTARRHIIARNQQLATRT
jgi:hypothetical protein